MTFVTALVEIWERGNWKVVDSAETFECDTVTYLRPEDCR